MSELHFCCKVIPIATLFLQKCFTIHCPLVCHFKYVLVSLRFRITSFKLLPVPCSVTLIFFLVTKKISSFVTPIASHRPLWIFHFTSILGITNKKPKHFTSLVRLLLDSLLSHYHCHKPKINWVYPQSNSPFYSLEKVQVIQSPMDPRIWGAFPENWHLKPAFPVKGGQISMLRRVSSYFVRLFGPRATRLGFKRTGRAVRNIEPRLQC